MENLNEKKITAARNALQKIPGWMAIEFMKAVEEYHEPVEERWLETKRIILNFLDSFAESNGYECKYEEYNSLDFAIKMTTDKLTVDKNDFEVLMVLAAADEITVKVADVGKGVELEAIFARYQNGMLLRWL